LPGSKLVDFSPIPISGLIQQIKSISLKLLSLHTGSMKASLQFRSKKATSL
jgi:hypothetical protein